MKDRVRQMRVDADGRCLECGLLGDAALRGEQHAVYATIVERHPVCDHVMWWRWPKPQPTESTVDVMEVC